MTLATIHRCDECRGASLLLAMAAVCVNCETVFAMEPEPEGRAGCPTCGSPTFVPLERWIGSGNQGSRGER